jgi:2-aminoadipate transaminase
MTNGSSQAIALVVQALAAPGDVCLCEAPTFLGTIHHIRFQGVRTVPVSLDDDGIDVEGTGAEIQRLEAAGPRRDSSTRSRRSTIPPGRR